MATSERQVSGHSLASLLLGLFLSSAAAQVTYAKFTISENYHFFIRLGLIFHFLIVLVFPYFSRNSLRPLRYIGILAGSVGFFVLFFRAASRGAWLYNTLFQAVVCLFAYFAFSFVGAAQPFLVKSDVETYGTSLEAPSVIVYGQQPSPPVYGTPTPPAYVQSYAAPMKS